MEPKRIIKEFNDLSTASPRPRDESDPTDAVIAYFKNVMKFSQNKALRAKVRKTMLQVCEEQIKALGTVRDAGSFRKQLSTVEKLVTPYMLSQPPMKDKENISVLLGEQVQTIRDWKMVALRYPLFGLDESLMDAGISKLNALIRDIYLEYGLAKAKQPKQPRQPRQPKPKKE